MLAARQSAPVAGFPVERRVTSDGTMRRCTKGADGAEIRSRRRSTACSPSRRWGSLTAVSAGSAWRTTGLSSKTATERSCGIRSPRSRAAASTAIARKSAAAKIAVGRCGKASSSWTACAAVLSVKPSRTSWGSYGIPACASELRYPASRKCANENSGATPK